MRIKALIKPIGIVAKVEGETSQVKIFKNFCKGLKNIDDFSHIIILYWFHLRDNEADRGTLRVVPKRHAGAQEVGVFASRSPSRPNPIGLCVCELLKVESCNLFVKGLDALEGSPVIDIKPYLPRADCISDAKTPEWTQHGPPI